MSLDIPIGISFLIFMTMSSNWYSAAFQCDPFAKTYMSCNCDETASTITCHGGFGSGKGVFQHLPTGVREVVITGNNFTELPVNLFGSCTGSSKDKQHKSLIKLDISDNNITVIHGKTFHCIPNVEELILRNNDWHLDNHNHVFSSMSKLKVLNLDNAFRDEINCTYEQFKKIYTGCTKSLSKLTVYINTTGMAALENLNLARNEIWTIPQETREQLGSLINLRILDLSDNNIARPRLNYPIRNLQELNLNSNRIPYLNNEFMEDLTKQPSLQHLYIQDNLYECDCWMKNFTVWLKDETLSKVVNNSDDLECFVGYGETKEGDKIKEINVGDLVCPADDNVTYRYSPTIMALSILCVMVAAFLLVILFLNRNKIKSAWKSCFSSQSQSGLYVTPRSQHAYSSVQT